MRIAYCRECSPAAVLATGRELEAIPYHIVSDDPDVAVHTDIGIVDVECSGKPFSYADKADWFAHVSSTYGHLFV